MDEGVDKHRVLEAFESGLKPQGGLSPQGDLKPQESKAPSKAVLDRSEGKISSLSAPVLSQTGQKSTTSPLPSPEIRTSSPTMSQAVPTPSNPENPLASSSTPPSLPGVASDPVPLDHYPEGTAAAEALPPSSLWSETTLYTINQGCSLLVFLIGTVWLSLGLYHPTPLTLALASLFTVPVVLDKHHHT